MKTYYIYIMANRSRTLYVGVTNNLERRIFEHRNHLVDGFTKKYRITRLVYIEETSNVESAIMREKQIKSWRRDKKLNLIDGMNPAWDDLADGWFEEQIRDRGEQVYGMGEQIPRRFAPRNDRQEQIPRCARNDRLDTRNDIQEQLPVRGAL
ncbi:MAG: GIY-YIG nuclease family protein [Thermoleophilia bacterium]